jgi:hypothetical protein
MEKRPDATDKEYREQVKAIVESLTPGQKKLDDMLRGLPKEEPPNEEIARLTGELETLKTINLKREDAYSELLIRADKAEARLDLLDEWMKWGRDGGVRGYVDRRVQDGKDAERLFGAAAIDDAREE